MRDLIISISDATANRLQRISDDENKPLEYVASTILREGVDKLWELAQKLREAVVEDEREKKQKEKANAALDSWSQSLSKGGK